MSTAHTQPSGMGVTGGRGALEGQRPPCSEPTVFSESGAGPRGRPVSRLHGRPRRVRRGKEGTGAEGPLLGGLSEDSATPQGSGPWGGEREAGQSPQLLLHHAHAHTAASPSGSDPQRTGQFSQSIVFPQTCPMCLAPPPPTRKLWSLPTPPPPQPPSPSHAVVQTGARAGSAWLCLRGPAFPSQCPAGEPS